jgi:formiminotetrahydrofolate cyclodeaminase
LVVCLVRPTEACVSNESPDRIAHLPSFRYTVADLLQENIQDPSMGSGSSAAWALALACSLVVRGGRQTVGREGYEAFSEEMKRVANRGQTLLELAQGLIDQEAAAHGRLIEALNLPQATPDEVEIRRGCTQAALRQCIQVHATGAQTAVEAQGLAESIFRYGTPSVKTDASLGIRMASVAVEGFASLATDQLDGILEESWADDIRNRFEQMHAPTTELDREASNHLWQMP